MPEIDPELMKELEANGLESMITQDMVAQENSDASDLQKNIDEYEQKPAAKEEPDRPSYSGRMKAAGMMGVAAALGMMTAPQERMPVSAGYQPYDGKFKRKINKNRSKAKAAKKARQRNRR